jgi:hypothetical protein
MKTARQIMDRQVEEKDFQQQVIVLAQTMHYKVAHFRPARACEEDEEGNQRWSTPVQADGAGFPDLIILKDALAYPGIAAEIKSEQGKLTIKQRMWLRLFYYAGFKVAVWRPRDWEKILTVIK